MLQSFGGLLIDRAEASVAALWSLAHETVDNNRFSLWECQERALK
jgi:hypothetical protein